VFCTAVLVMSLLVWSVCAGSRDKLLPLLAWYKVAGSIVKYCWLMSVRDY